MRKLIATSCKFEKKPNLLFSNFHKVFLRFSFNAVDVIINYEDQEIHTSNSKPLTTNSVRLFDLNKAIADSFSYSDLEETLLGCIKTGQLQHSFYKKMLLEYGNLTNNSDL